MTVGRFTGVVLGTALGAALTVPLLAGFQPASAASRVDSPGTGSPVMEPPVMEPPVTGAPGAGGRVLLVGVPGLRWDDISAAGTPALWRIVGDGSIAALSVRTVRPRACPLDGWLTLNTGTRVAVDRPGPGDGAVCPPVPTPTTTPVPAGAAGALRVPGWEAFTGFNRQFGYTPRFGTLGGAGTAVLAVGPGAAVALADAGGRVPAYQASASQISPDDLARYRLTVVDLGALPERAGPESTGAEDRLRAEAVREADRQLGRLTGALTDPGTTVLVAGIADSEWTPHLHVVAATGPGHPPAGWLTATSTRNDGLVQLTDITPTVLAALGRRDALAPLVGSVLERSGDRPRDAATTPDAVRRLVERDTAAQLVRANVGGFFTLFTFGLLLGVGAVVLAWGRVWTRDQDRDRGQDRGWGRGRRLAWAGMLLLAAVPVATFLANLVPWWTAGAPVAVLAVTVTAWAVVIATLAAVGPWRRHPLGPPGVVAAVTAGVLTADVVAGSPLQDSSLLGLSPLVAGRFYGFGNVAFTVLAMAAVTAATWGAALFTEHGERRRAVLTVAGIGTVAVIADGWPAFGSDFGGVLAMVPGFALLALLVAGRGLSVARVAAVAAFAVVVVGVIAVLDWLRPVAERSHLGRFVQQVLDGQALEIIGRKATTNLNSFSSPLSLLVPVAFVLLAVLVLNPERMRAGALVRAYQRIPVLRAGLIGLWVTAVLGFAVNDSGVTVPAVALTVAVPLVVAAVAAAESGPCPQGPCPPGT